MLGQEKAWVEQLRTLLKRDSVNIIEGKTVIENIQLIVTEYPVEDAGKGILPQIPFLVVSKECSEENILEAFGAGAEDYMIYPVSPEIARVRILRILSSFKKNTDDIKKLQLKLHFTPNEYKLLAYMMEHPKRVLSRTELLEGAFEEIYEGYDRNVDNYIKQIRKKMELTYNEAGRIETVYGAGYRYMPENEKHDLGR